MNQGPMKYRPVNRSNAEARKKRLATQKSVKLAVVALFVLLAATFLILLISLTVSSSRRRSELEGLASKESDNSSNTLQQGESQGGTTDNTNNQTEQSSEKPLGPFTYKYIEKSENALHLGNLILVDSNNAYTFADPTGMVDIRYIRAVSSSNVALYSMATITMMLRPEALEALNNMISATYFDTAEQFNVQPVSISVAYRSYEEQQSLYENNPGAGALAPGTSDYHTGYSFNIRSVGTGTEIEGLYSSAVASCYKYGIIQRYPDSKADITGINYDSNHYRYVGIPHSYIMNEMDYCLEQYLEYIKAYPVSGEHRIIDIDSVGSYEIYYVAANVGAATQVPVPEGYEYTVSGDNVGGFIVTVTLK